MLPDRQPSTDPGVSYFLLEVFDGSRRCHPMGEHPVSIHMLNTVHTSWAYCVASTGAYCTGLDHTMYAPPLESYNVFDT